MRDWSLKSGVVIATAKVASRSSTAPTGYNIATALTMYTTRLVDVVRTDPRSQTSPSINIYENKLILFPTLDNKPKA